MVELIGLVAFGTFGLIAAIAEREPQSDKKKLTRKSRHSHHHR